MFSMHGLGNAQDCAAAKAALADAQRRWELANAAMIQAAQGTPSGGRRVLAGLGSMGDAASEFRSATAFLNQAKRDVERNCQGGSKSGNPVTDATNEVFGFLEALTSGAMKTVTPLAKGASDAGLDLSSFLQRGGRTFVQTGPAIGPAIGPGIALLVVGGLGVAVIVAIAAAGRRRSNPGLPRGARGLLPAALAAGGLYYIAQARGKSAEHPLLAQRRAAWARAELERKAMETSQMQGLAADHHAMRANALDHAKSGQMAGAYS